MVTVVDGVGAQGGPLRWRFGLLWGVRPNDPWWRLSMESVCTGGPLRWRFGLLWEMGSIAPRGGRSWAKTVFYSSGCCVMFLLRCNVTDTMENGRMNDGRNSYDG